VSAAPTRATPPLPFMADYPTENTLFHKKRKIDGGEFKKAKGFSGGTHFGSAEIGGGTCAVLVFSLLS